MKSNNQKYSFKRSIVAMGCLAAFSPLIFGQCTTSTFNGVTVETIELPGVGGYDNSGAGSYIVPYTTIIKDADGKVLQTIDGQYIDSRSVAHDSENQCYYYSRLSSVYINAPFNPGSAPAFQNLPVPAAAWLEQMNWSGHYENCSPYSFVIDQDSSSFDAIVVKDVEELNSQSCLGGADPKNNDPPPCGGSSPNPIAYRDGNKWLVEQDTSLNDLPFVRKYNSNPRTATTSIGAHWSTGFESALFFSPPVAGAQPYSKLITASRGDGAQISFAYANERYTSTGDRKEVIKIIRNASGGIVEYDFYTENKLLERYTANGKLISVTDELGRTTQFSYVNGDLSSVSAPSGRTLNFTYLITPDMREGAAINAPGKVIYNISGDIAYTSSDTSNGTLGYSVIYVNPPIKYPSVGQLGYTANPALEDSLPVVTRSANRLLTVKDSNGNVYAYNYDDYRNLVSVTYPGGDIKKYVYEDGTFTHALTGIIDEKNVRFSTYYYDSEGRATSEALANGVGSYGLDFSVPNTTSVSDPLGNVRTYGYQNIFGGLKNVSQSQPDGSGCLAATSSKTFNPDATVASETDFNGITKAYQYDPLKALPTKITEASGKALARETNLQWHPYWKLATQVDEATQVTTNVYNGDSGAQCAPANALTLKDDDTQIPIPVLCSQTVRAKLAGVVDTSVPARVSSYTYDVVGRVLTQTDSNGHMSTYAYYGDTSFTGVDPNAAGHRMGDLQSITNAAGHVTRFDLYTKNGDLLQSTDSKGITTVMTYTPRGWLSTITTTVPSQAPRLTSFTYDPVGQQTGVSLPDGTTLTRVYDDAHRLISVSDGLGNKVSYTLDALGNRINESFSDPNGVLQRTIDRSMDALNRVQQVTGK